MDILRRSLEVIFREQNPNDILIDYFNLLGYKKNSSQKINKNKFIYLFQNSNISKSRDEIENIYKLTENNMRNSNINDKENVYNLLINYLEEFLEYSGGNVRCKYKGLLKWRMISHKLDQDVLISAFIAYKDVLIGKKENNLEWDLNIKSNNERLNNILLKGLAENHFHLKGSAPTYYISWIAIMNNLYINNDILNQIDENRLELDCYGNFSIKDGIIIAAIIRIILFYYTMYKENDDYLKEAEKKLIF